MALFDQIYEHKNTMQAIKDTEVIEAFENLEQELKSSEEEYEESKRKSMFDEKHKKRLRIINTLAQVAKYIEDSDVDPDSINMKISIGKDYKIRIKGKRFWEE